MKIFPADFFERPALKVAPELLGQYLCRRLDDGSILTGVISEVEAYIGRHDLACHASKGRTARTEVLFGPPGHWYVYLCYGIHELVNIVTATEGYPAAVLIRGTLDVAGPGRVTKKMGIDRRFNGQPARPETGLWLADSGLHLTRTDYVRTPRIGVDYAGPVWAAKPYRFVAKSERLKEKISQTKSR